jgi:hypothetical protein
VGSVIIFVMLSILLALSLRRRRVGAGGVERDPNRRSFRGVWMQTTPPRAAMRAYKDRATGTLTTDPMAGLATFTRKDGSVLEFRKPRAVSMGPRGSDFANTWVEVRYENGPGVAWLNDGRWLGWRAILTRSNIRIAAALKGLLPEDVPPIGDPP